MALRASLHDLAQHCACAHAWFTSTPETLRETGAVQSVRSHFPHLHRLRPGNRRSPRLCIRQFHVQVRPAVPRPGSSVVTPVRPPSVQDLFSAFGPVSRIYVAYDRETGEHRGFAFVNFLYRQPLAPFTLDMHTCRAEMLFTSMFTRQAWLLPAHAGIVLSKLHPTSCPHGASVAI